MKQGKIIKAYQTLTRLGEQELPLNVSYQLFKLKRALTPAWDFQLEREGEIFEKYPPVENTPAGYKFKTPEIAKEFTRVLNELADMDSDITVNPIQIPNSDTLKLSIKDFESLEGFVIFEGLEEHHCEHCV